MHIVEKTSVKRKRKTDNLLKPYHDSESPSSSSSSSYSFWSDVEERSADGNCVSDNDDCDKNIQTNRKKRKMCEELSEEIDFGENLYDNGEECKPPTNPKITNREIKPTIFGKAYGDYKSIKLAVVGSRNITNYSKVSTIIEKTIKKIENITGGFVHTIVSGGAKGVDTLAEDFAHYNRYAFQVFYPDPEEVKKGNKKIYFERSKDIVNNADYVLAIWDGVSTGTKQTIAYARKSKKMTTSLNTEFGKYTDDLIVLYDD